MTGFRAQKSLGQHFLVDRGVVRALIEGARLAPSDVVVEIGPGLGALTFPLAGEVRHVVAVEKDIRAYEELERRLRDMSIGNVDLVQCDILRFPLESVAARFSRKVTVVGNLPYNISKPVLEKLLRSREVVDRSILMFQAEVADRLLASPGGKAYGALTLMVRFRASAGLILSVPKESFRPKPKVSSKVVCLDFSSPFCVNTDDESRFDTVVRAAFSHRRKTLINSLMGSGYKWHREMLADVLADCGIDPSRRAETLNMEEFMHLAARLNPA
ncbi:MAG TPA: ribosomal RNA small subunit methyltransferase A [Desulfobacteraceae bacterium]|nr:ribosomal RNA small subunit methyltransferase A [Desulfobacteraceae bacterium]